MPNRTATTSPRAIRRSAFTLTELLVVIAIIVLLIGVITVVIGSTAKRAQVVKTQFLMNSIASGLVQFNTDFGYYPPVLGRKDASPPVEGFARDVVRYSDISGSNDLERQQLWYSYTTLADFLIGYGHRGEDGYGIVRGGPAGPGNREAPPFGIRSPGSDGCWGAVYSPQPTYANSPAARGGYRARNPARLAQPPAVTNNQWNAAAVEGRVYGPYIDSMDERLIGGLTGFDASGRPSIVTNDQGIDNFDQLPKVLLDYWGEPIAYYRAPYGGDDLKSNVPSQAGGFLNLGDVFVLRDYDILEGDRSEGAADARGDRNSNGNLKSASFALFSNGPDRLADRGARRDLNEVNKDNIVEAAK
ncbi:MAG: type II secretion system protein [Phycisphaerales bacterium]